MTKNKELIEEYFQALSRGKDPNTVAKFVTDARLADHIAEMESAFPNYQIVVEDLVSEGDKVALRGQFRGVHKGEFAGIAPTGKSVSGELMIFYRIEDQKIVDHWMQFDASAVIAQLKEASARGAHS